MTVLNLYVKQCVIFVTQYLISFVFIYCHYVTAIPDIAINNINHLKVQPVYLTKKKNTDTHKNTLITVCPAD